MRYSELERAIPGISQKMLGQQLRGVNADGIVVRTDFHEVPPKVEYRLTTWGQELCPALDAILTWAALREPVGSSQANGQDDGHDQIDAWSRPS